MSELVMLFFGAEFTESVFPASVLLVGALFGSTRKVIVEILRGYSLPHASTVVELLSYPVFVVAGILFVTELAMSRDGNYSGSDPIYRSHYC